MQYLLKIKQKCFSSDRLVSVSFTTDHPPDPVILSIAKDLFMPDPPRHARPDRASPVIPGVFRVIPGLTRNLLPVMPGSDRASPVIPGVFRVIPGLTRNLLPVMPGSDRASPNP